MRTSRLPLALLLVCAPLVAATTTGPRVAGRAKGVALTFELATARIRAGQTPAIRIELKNTGKGKFAIARDVFNDPNLLRENTNAEFGTFVDALGPDGRPLETELYTGPDQAASGESWPSAEHRKAVQEQVDRWRAQGVSIEEINRRLEKWSPPQSATRPNVIVLTKGMSAVFPSTASASRFAPLSIYSFPKPGTYRLRAVYDMTLSDADKRVLGDSARPRREDLRVETGWVELVVEP